MAERANYFKLGLFVIGAIVAGILVLLVIGTGRFLQKRVTIETYFNESVQGLDIGSQFKKPGGGGGEGPRKSASPTSRTSKTSRWAIANVTYSSKRRFSRD